MLVMYRRYPNHVAPYKSKVYVRYEHEVVYDYQARRIRGEYIPNVKNSASKLSSFNSRWRSGGFEVNVFELSKAGFDEALALLETKPVSEAHLTKCEITFETPEQLEMWVLQQLELGATKRVK